MEGKEKKRKFTTDTMEGKEKKKKIDNRHHGRKRKLTRDTTDI